MPPMTKAQIDEFLKGPHIAKIATIREGNAPYVVPVWYEWDGQNLLIIGRKRSIWVEHIRKNPKVAVLIDDVKPPYPKVIIEGVAEIIGTDWVEIGKRMVVRYFGSDVGLKYLEGSLDQPRWVIKVKPERITSWIIPPEFAGGKEAWHPRYYEPRTKWYEEYIKEKGR